MLRFATPGDAEALLRIYAQYIDTSITFECTLPSADEFRRRIVDISRDYPYLVCEAGGRLLGYAYAHRHKEREAYQWNAELSVYIDRNAHSLGLGKQLYAALIEILRLQNVKNVLGCVTLPNEKSARLHENMGFTLVGTYPMGGYKADAWHDVGWFQKNIAPYDEPPAPFIPLREVAATAIESALENSL